MKFPSMPKKGVPVAETTKDIINYLRSIRVTSVVNGRLLTTPNGTSIVCDPKGKPASAASATPKALTIKNGTEAGKFQIIPGYVNSVMPTLSATALNATTPPEITVTADVWVWLKCVGTFGSPDSYVVTVETSATAGVPSGTAISGTGFTSFYYIGQVDFTAGTPATYEITNQHSGGNLGVDSWGLYNAWWRA